MNNKTNNTIYLVVTVLLSLLMSMSAGMYIFKYADVSEIFKGLGFPTFIIYPLAIAKILGLVAIWTNKSKTLKQWAYAGFVFDFLLAIGAHLSVNDGDSIGAIIALVLVSVSWYFDRKIRG